jgi:ubiquinone/menaquinone biosynthesis C-methylase UbiE
MNTEEAYNNWSQQYDTNENKTRDLEAIALRENLIDTPFAECLEIGCGTGKNTLWLVEKAIHVTAVDFSSQMLARAKEKIRSGNAEFMQVDFTKPWTFAKKKYDLITFSLVLEHIENLEHIFRECSLVLKPGGYIYIGELHPFKQYSGSKARFENEKRLLTLECFTHHLSDFIIAAKKSRLHIVNASEYFDNNDRSSVPRILVMIFVL